MVKYNVKKNAIIGSLTTILLQVFTMIMQFVMKTVFMYTLGIEYMGLNSLFSSILQVLNLAELGVGSALVFSMYKPIAEGDDKQVCALLKLYKRYYYVISIIILILGIGLIPVLKFLVKSDVPSDVNLYILYGLNLSSTFFSYSFCAYRSSVFQALQKKHYLDLIAFLTNVIKYVFQIICVITWKNYYLYLVIGIVFILVNNLIVAVSAKRKYPNYVAAGEVALEDRKIINSKVLNLFWAKLCGVITNSADTIVISSFLGLIILGKYNFYYYILTAIITIFSGICSALRPGIGNALLVNKKIEIERQFYSATFAIAFLANICACCIINIMPPFMELWIKKENTLGFTIVLLICAYFVSYVYPIFWAIYKDAAGCWKEDRIRSIVCPIFNLVTNIILVNTIGLTGVLISTVVTYACVSGPWLLHNINKYVLRIDMKRYILKILKYYIITFVSIICSFGVCELIAAEGLNAIILNLAVSLLIPSALFVLINIKSYELSETIDAIRRKFK